MIANPIPIFASLLALIAATVALDAQQDRDRDRAKSGKGGRNGGAGVVAAEVPSYRFNTWLCRPGADSITVSVMAWEALECIVHYGENAGSLTSKSESVLLAAGESRNIVLGGLKPGTGYVYQVHTKAAGGEFLPDEVRSFHTQRKPGAAFTFVMQADSHLDTNTNVQVYQQTLDNMFAAKPDFMIDLGDTTMVDKFGVFYSRAESQYRAQRYHMGRIAHSVPIFLALGNHDGEKAERLNGKPDAMPLWSLANRKKYFPNPEPGGIYSGNEIPFEGAGLLQNYYAWDWGDAQFIVLDPFWATKRDSNGDDNWNRTLGEEQYRWLTKALESSDAAFRFVFLHHLVGGLDHDVRGGIVNVPYLEWGGKNSDGSDGFAKNRPEWPMPIHQLFLKHHVSAVFHGHDHLYVREEIDGIVYQEVPQPGHPNGHTRSAMDYRYQGEVRPASGHVRVTVEPGEALVEYVFTTVPGVTGSQEPNASIQHRYVIKPR